jgi:hypothetical protein
MKHVNIFFKIYAFIITLFFCSETNAQVSGFSISPPGSTVAIGTPFQIGLSYATGPNTISDTVRITYNPAMVSYDSLSTYLPDCMQVIDNSPVLTIIAANCVNIGSVGVSVGFTFVCQDTCTGVPKTAIFTGRITDNLGTVVSPSSTTATGILANSLNVSHTFLSYNSATNRITYRVSYSNPTCFKINGIRYNLALTPPPPTVSVISVTGAYIYNQSLSAFVPSSGFLAGNTSGNFQYVVQLPCTTVASDTFKSKIIVTGNNCDTVNTLLASPPTVIYAIPINPVNIAPISVSSAQAPGLFRYTVTNNSPSPVSLTINSYLPAVRLTGVLQTTNQTTTPNNYTYFDCALAPTNFSLTGNNVSNTGVPANTRRIQLVVNNLAPGKYIQLDKNYDLSGSCNGAAGAPPYKDSTSVSYRCLPDVNVCDTCGPGNTFAIVVYNPLPAISCFATTTMTDCKDVGDTITLSYSFKNVGAATLVSPIYNVPLPSWLQIVPLSFTSSGFPATPAITNSGNIQFALPDLPPSNTQVYTLSFKVVIQTGALGGVPFYFTNTISGAGGYNVNVCQTTLRVCAISSLDIVKRVKGSGNSAFAFTGTGAPNTDVEYQIILTNSGTTVITDPIVIDRVPKQGNLTIMGNPTISSPVNNWFAMQMLTVPPSTDYATTYNTVQNACTGWGSTGTNCITPATWTTSSVNAAAVKFTFTPGFQILPGTSDTFTFKMHIPAGLANGLEDCNTAGILVTVLNGPPLFATESNSACITVQNPCGIAVSPNFTPAYSCLSNGYNVTVNSSAGSPAQHQWSLMQMNSCSGFPNDGTSVQVGITQTSQNALFIVPTGTTCYYIRHRVFVPGCYDTTSRVQITVPSASIAFNMQDSIGNVKNTFCSGENVIFNGTASTGESQYNVEIRRRPTGSGTFVSWANVGPFNGQATTLNLSQLLLAQNKFFEPGFQYGIYFTISNPGNCITPMTAKDAITIECCDGFFNPGFQMQVNPAAGSYTITSVLFNTYATANATHEWYVLSSPNPVGGPYTPVYSSAATTLIWSGAQYNEYYTVIHKVVTSCGEFCSSRSQWQTNNKSESEEVDGCCLAAFYWANGPGNPPAPMSADFDISIASSGNAYYTINVSPTNTYSNLPGVTHEWYLWSSPNPFGGPYTPVSQGNYTNFAFNGATDALYYFIVHKVKTPCGEVCYTQDICRNCGEKKACDIKWPDCYPPTNLKNDCRRHALSWDPVSAAGAYEIELYYNDPECCKSEYFPSVKSYSFDGNVFDLDNYDHPKFNCIRWRVRAKCDKGYSEWSSWLCYYCGEVIGGPVFPLTEKSGGNRDAVKQQPIVTPQVLPNPNNGDMFLKMKTNGELIVSVNVFNSTGLLVKTIAESKYPDGNFVKSLNLGSGVAKGLYLIVFKTNFGTYTEKVIIN